MIRNYESTFQTNRETRSRATRANDTTKQILTTCTVQQTQTERDVQLIYIVQLQSDVILHALDTTAAQQTTDNGQY